MPRSERQNESFLSFLNNYLQDVRIYQTHAEERLTYEKGQYEFQAYNRRIFIHFKYVLLIFPLPAFVHNLLSLHMHRMLQFSVSADPTIYWQHR